MLAFKNLLIVGLRLYDHVVFVVLVGVAMLAGSHTHLQVTLNPAGTKLVNASHRNGLPVLFSSSSQCEFVCTAFFVLHFFHRQSVAMLASLRHFHQCGHVGWFPHAGANSIILCSLGFS